MVILVTEQKVQAQYDEIAAVYDVRWHSYITGTLAALPDWLSLVGNESILDVACGTGELERLLLAKHPQLSIVGLDLSANMLAVARQKGLRGVGFSQGSAIDLPFPDGTFDVLVTANSFHYFDFPHLALQEMRRVLKPRGKVVILDWCRDYFFCRLCDLVLKKADPAYRTCYTQQELHTFLHDANFKVIDQHQFRLDVIWGLMLATAVKKEKR
ncbi:MAG: class I SAM-dependent methyltransferase [Ardenticatenaceae bacterium]